MYPSPRRQILPPLQPFTRPIILAYAYPSRWSVITSCTKRPLLHTTLLTIVSSILLKYSLIRLSINPSWQINPSLRKLVIYDKRIRIMAHLLLPVASDAKATKLVLEEGYSASWLELPKPSTSASSQARRRFAVLSEFEDIPRPRRRDLAGSVAEAAAPEAVVGRLR